RGRRAAEEMAAAHTRDLEARVSELLRLQSEMTGRMQTMAEVFGSRQSDMMRAVNERLDGMGHKLGQTMADTTRNTHEGLRQLHERLAVIDRAQRTITDLSGQVVEDRKSTRLNSSHVKISYAVFCLKKKTITSRTRY